MHDIATHTVLSELGLSDGSHLAGPYFTGWFSPTSSSVGMVGRIVQWLPRETGKPRRFAYVCLPSFESGTALEGSFLDHGRERLTEVCSIDDMRRMFVTGLKQLKEIVASEGAVNAT